MLMGYASLKHEYASTPTNKCNKIELQADQLLKHEEREPISPAISAWGIIEYHKRGVTLETSANSPFRVGEEVRKLVVNEIIEVKPFNLILAIKLRNLFRKKKPIIIAVKKFDVNFFV
ncbi:MAG: hypothetical protein RXQ93_07280 [Caldisphaera sp.]